MFVKICPNCKTQNAANADFCSNESCSSFLGQVLPVIVDDERPSRDKKHDASPPVTIQEKQSMEKYVICPTCGSKVHVEDDRIPSMCPFCDNDDIRRLTQCDIMLYTDDNTGSAAGPAGKRDLDKYNDEKKDGKSIRVELFHKETGEIIRMTDHSHTFGRYGDMDCKFLNSMRYVSGKHLSISIRDNRLYVTDLKSRNGTSLNGMPLIPMREYVVEDSATLVMADQSFVVHIDAD